MAAPLIASIAAACAYGAASVLQSTGAKRGGGQPGAKGLVAIVRDPSYLAGLGLDLVGWFLMVYAVRHLPVFAVQTVLAGSLVVTAILGWALLGSRLRPVDFGVMAASILGLVLVGSAAGADHPVDRHGMVSWLLVIWCPAAVVAGAVACRSAGPITTGCVAGVLFSLGVTSIRTIDHFHSIGEVITSPLVWAVGVYSAGALGLHARALEKGKVGPVTAATWTTEIVVGSTLGLVLLGDTVRPGAGWQALIGITIALGATVILANGSQHEPVDPVREHIAA